MTHDQLTAMHKSLISRADELRELAKLCHARGDASGMTSANAGYSVVVSLCDAIKAAIEVTPR